MSMYNLLFGNNPAATVILKTLGLEPADVGRLRDVYVCNGEIAVYTRNGGGNRECWNYDAEEGEPYDSAECDCPGCIITHRLPKHPQYLRDKDDEFDNTYATIYFSFPEQYAEGLRAMDTKEPWNPDEAWHQMITAIKDGVVFTTPEEHSAYLAPRQD